MAIGWTDWQGRDLRMMPAREWRTQSNNRGIIMIFRSQTYLIATASIIALSLLPVSAGVGPIRAESRLLAAQSASQSAADQGSGDKRDGSHDFDLLFTEC